MPNVDWRVFELPCRFPAKPSIVALKFMIKLEFLAWRSHKKFFTLSFPARQGRGWRHCLARFRGFAAVAIAGSAARAVHAAHRCGTGCALRRRGGLVARSA
jgi:hypothetical protein